jgi:toxin FitB
MNRRQKRSIVELMFGHRPLAQGTRKDKLAALDGELELFTNRILPFDIGAAGRFADLAVKARAAGKGFPTVGRGRWRATRRASSS